MASLMSKPNGAALKLASAQLLLAPANLMDDADLRWSQITIAPKLTFEPKARRQKGFALAARLAVWVSAIN